MKAFLRKITGNHEVTLGIILVLLFIVVDILSGFKFHGIENIGDIFKNNALTLIMSLGMLCVLITGGIDISITGTLFSGTSTPPYGWLPAWRTWPAPRAIPDTWPPPKAYTITCVPCRPPSAGCRNTPSGTLWTRNTAKPAASRICW